MALVLCAYHVQAHKAFLLGSKGLLIPGSGSLLHWRHPLLFFFILGQVFHVSPAPFLPQEPGIRDGGWVCTHRQLEAPGGGAGLAPAPTSATQASAHKESWAKTCCGAECMAEGPTGQGSMAVCLSDCVGGPGMCPGLSLEFFPPQHFCCTRSFYSGWTTLTADQELHTLRYLIAT